MPDVGLSTEGTEVTTAGEVTMRSVIWARPRTLRRAFRKSAVRRATIRSRSSRVTNDPNRAGRTASNRRASRVDDRVLQAQRALGYRRTFVKPFDRDLETSDRQQLDAMTVDRQFASGRLRGRRRIRRHRGSFPGAAREDAIGRAQERGKTDVDQIDVREREHDVRVQHDALVQEIVQHVQQRSIPLVQDSSDHLA